MCLPGSFTLCFDHAAIRVSSPKNRRQFGDQQFVLLKHPNAVRWLAKVHRAENVGRLWPGSARQFSALFKQLTQELHIQECRFTPASLRPGGATTFYNHGVPISTLRSMGHWSVERTLENYLQLAMATQILNKLGCDAVSRLKKLGPLCLLQVVSDL